MKTLRLILAATIFCLFNIAFSQTGYFGSTELVPLFAPEHSGIDESFTQRSVHFDLSEVNESNGRLDLVSGVSEYQFIPFNQIITEYYDVDGSVYLNSNDSNFDSGSSTFIGQYLTNQPYNRIQGIVFAQLRNSAKKDVVVLRDSNIAVYRNSSGNINTKLDSIRIINAQNITKGNFNYNDIFEDVIVLYDDTLRIFKSNGNGTLDPSYFSAIPFSGTISKIISKQLSLENEPFRTINGHSGTTERDEIIFSSGSNIYIYSNSNNNSYTYSQTLSFSNAVRDFEISDVNNDGFNDLIVVGGNPNNSTAYLKVLLNNGSGSINSTATFSTNSNILINSLISTGDFNKDGWNDIVMGSTDSINIFENIKGTNLFSSSSISNHYFITSPTLYSTKKMMIADLTNEGGLSVLLSGHTLTFNEQSNPPILNENILRINPSVENTNPSPAYLFESYVQYHDNIYHPKLLLFNRGDRDFLKYRIYKKNWVTYHYYLFDSSTASEYIDTTEDLLYVDQEPPDPRPPDNLFYYVVAVDNSYKVSITSDTIAYPAYVCPTCWGEIGPDNFVASNENNNLPREYSLKQNYPNPFNPTTNIQYDLPSDNFVTIKIYNILGKEIMTLVNEFKNAGSYIVSFNASNLSSGIYYYKLKSGDVEMIRKMVVIK